MSRPCRNLIAKEFMATTDCVVRTADGGEFPAHRALLAATSGYFQAAFSEGIGASRDVTLDGVSAVVFEELLYFLYTDSICLDSDNVLQILEAADCLMMDEARDKCLQYLIGEMRQDNCLGFAALAKPHYAPFFKEALLKFIREHFDEVWRHSDEFLHTRPELLCEVLSSDELNVRKEVDLLRALDRWISSATDEDLTALPALLQCVRVGLCSQSELDEIRQRCPDFVRTKEYQEAIEEALQRALCRCQPSPLVLWATLAPGSLFCGRCGGSPPYRWRPRLPYEVLAVVGGCSDDGQIEVYDPKADRWIVHTNNDAVTPRVYHGVALLGTRIYVVGGCTTGDTYLRTVDGFDTVTGDWEHCDSMHVAHAFVPVAVLDGHLYAIGGHTGYVRTASVERYIPHRNHRTMVASLRRRRSAAAACAYRGKLYVSGGSSGGDVLSSVEEYTVELDSWVLVMSMPSPRSNHRMVVHDDSIYVIGGYNGRRRLDLVLKNVGNVVREWEDVAPLSVSRSSFTVVDFRGEIYVIGGVTGYQDVRWRQDNRASPTAGFGGASLS
ncbi:kelch-like protein 10 isoform X2 [Dermacentor albipictus]|uniref:kelch-like protein 10 isoform X2 n=1 Tax=Dermacentor albipictus TaxID=60249 RepID=UPI0031FD4B1C